MTASAQPLGRRVPLHACPATHAKATTKASLAKTTFHLQGRTRYAMLTVTHAPTLVMLTTYQELALSRELHENCVAMKAVFPLLRVRQTGIQTRFHVWMVLGAPKLWFVIGRTAVTSPL